jgi:hypothetical protein
MFGAWLLNGPDTLNNHFNGHFDLSVALTRLNAVDVLMNCHIMLNEYFSGANSGHAPLNWHFLPD